MSVLDKQSFATELKNRLYDKLTEKDADVVISELIDLMGCFDIVQLASTGNDKEYFDMLDIYLNTLRMEGRSEKTVLRYKRELTRFHTIDPTPIRQITVFNVRQYLAREKARGIADSTLQGNRDIYHAYFGWLHREGMLATDPCANLRPVKGTEEERQPFTDVELELLKNGCNTVKEKAIVFFLLSTGCRISEVEALNKSDIDYQNREAKVLGKGNKWRYVYFTDIAAMYLKDYIASRTDDLDALFVSKFKHRMSVSGFQAVLKNLGNRVGVEDVFPHRFRHTFATNMLRSGMPIQEVSVLLGHSRIDTTTTYAHTSQDRVKLSYLRYA